ncbi:MAG: HAD family hydrolase [Miniphocaeibacter sp.]|uniref:HAD family hydrolase n=1 Tax=Miniphocaeibacter sp. TaxID=3100973 RepID=UPI00185614A9|nr:HAD family hydrolase [Gallicola sp.]
MYKAYVFDLDGTIIDSLNTIADCFNEELEKLGYKPADVELFKYFVGDGPRILTERAIKYIVDRDNLTYSKEEKEEIIKELHLNYLNSYNSIDDNYTEIYKGIRESLKYLKEKNKKIAVCTNKPLKAAKNVLENNFGKNYFDYIIGLDENTPRKPNPYMMEKLMKDLDLRKEEIAYFGDTSTDMLTAKNADVYGVGVTWGFRKREELEEYGADKIINDPLEIMNI